MRLKIIGNIFRKELTDISRDRRALVISVLIPLLLFPVSFFAMNMNLKSTAGSLESGIPVIIAINDDSKVKCITSGGRILPVISHNPPGDLCSGKAAAILEEKAQNSTDKSIHITYDNTSQYSSAAVSVIHGIVTNCYTDDISRERPSDTVVIYRETLVDARKGSGILMLQMLMPVLIFIFSATAPMAVAADLFAGEKERGTLEHLLAVPVTGAELLAGKYCAAICAGIIGVASFMGGIIISYYISPEVFGAEGITFSVSAPAVAVVIIFSLLVLMTFTSAEFAVSIFSRSAREAQILFIPVIIIAMALGQFVSMIDVKRISASFRHIPMINSGLVIKELIAGIYSWNFIVISAFWCIFLTLLFLSFSRNMLIREKYVFRG